MTILPPIAYFASFLLPVVYFAVTGSRGMVKRTILLVLAGQLAATLLVIAYTWICMIAGYRE